LQKVYIAAPGITGHRTEGELDTSIKIEGMYYKGRGPANMTPAAYVWKLEQKSAVDALFDRQIKEEREMSNRHYKELIEARTKFGA